MKRILIIGILGLIGCARSNSSMDKKEPNTDSTVVDGSVKVKEELASNTDFINYISLLPKIQLPFQTNCEICCNHPKVDYANELVKKFTPEHASILGLLEKREDMAVVIYTYPADIIFPIVKVYNLEGKKTDEMGFMTGYCGGDFEYYGKLAFRINGDLTLSQIDTLLYFTMDTVDYHIIDTTKIEITNKTFFVNGNGKIEEKY